MKKRKQFKSKLRNWIFLDDDLFSNELERQFINQLKRTPMIQLKKQWETRLKDILKDELRFQLWNNIK